MNILNRLAVGIVRAGGYQYPIENGKITNNYSTLLNNVTGKTYAGQQGLVLPTPPTPPADANDLEAQKTYNDALLAYNQQFQAYHTQMMSAFSQRFMMMQQTIYQAQQRSQSSSSSSQYDSASEIGSILTDE